MKTITRQLSVTLLAALTASAFAAERKAVLEEVIVTAQKKEESLQDTPISLNSFNSAALEAKGINNLEDLRSNVPNLQITPHPNSAGTARIFIRGIGNNDDQITQDPSVAVYLDGVYLARSQGLVMDVADVERIEVLRGPQGTLYGRNATGGAINTVTARPDTEVLEFSQVFSGGSRNLQRSKTSLNLPINDRLALRLAYLAMEQDGFVENLGTDIDNFGDRDRSAWRADLLWLANDALELRYSADRSVIDDSPAYVVPVALHPEQAERPHAGDPAVRNVLANEIISSGHSLSLEWTLSDYTTLRSITAFRELDHFQNQDFGTGVFGPFALFKNQRETDQQQWSQELQLLGDLPAAGISYIAGLYLFDEEADSQSVTLTPRDARTSNESIDNQALAVFGQGTWTPDTLDSRLHLTLGARWSKDERRASLGKTTAPANASDGQSTGKISFTDFSPSAVAAFDLSDDVNVYAKLVRGYKTGGFNTRASSFESFDRGFDEETLLSFELGIKSQFWDNRLRLNAAAFRSDYDDIQINVQSDPNDPSRTDVLNAGKASVDGAEMELTIVPLPGLEVVAKYAYLDGDYDEIKEADGDDIADQFRYPNAPQHSYSLDLEYLLPPLPVGDLSVRAGYTWQDEKYTSSTIDTGRFIVDNYGLLNARIALSNIPLPAGSLSIAAWGKNLEDKEYYIAHFDLRVISAAMFGEPRSYGFDLRYDF